MTRIGAASRSQAVRAAIGITVLWSNIVVAQPPGGMPSMQGHGGAGMHCPMMGGGMGMFMGVLGILFIVAAIGALVALAVFLVRRSRPRGPLQA
jgi:uncharacterized membrane protein